MTNGCVRLGTNEQKGIAVKRKYYSQHGEDYLIDQFFDEKNNGFYIDIGAFDGVHLSNTYSFELSGWTGVCVEPSLEMFKLCNETRANSHCFNCACSDGTSSKATFYTEDIGLLSTLESSHEKTSDVERRYKSRGLDFEGFRTQEISCYTINEILAKLPGPVEKIDFISIDVEGHEMAVLRGFDLSVYRPMVIVIEANDTYSEKEITEYLIRNHYFFSRKLGVNLFFCENKLASNKLKSIDIACELEKQIHPLGEKYTLPKFLSEQSVENKKVTRKSSQVEDKKHLNDLYRTIGKLVCYKKKIENDLEPDSSKTRVSETISQVSFQKDIFRLIDKLAVNRNLLPAPVLSNENFFVNDLSLHESVQPILIYQVGKVGSTSISAAIKDSIRDVVPVYQVHNIVHAAELKERDVKSGSFSSQKHFNLGQSLLEAISAQPSLSFKVITGIREPITRWVSEIFQNIDTRYNFLKNPDGSINEDEVVRFIKASIRNEPQSRWFEEEIGSLFGVSVRDIHLDKEKCCCVLKKNNNSFFFYKQEGLSSSTGDILAEFLELDSLSIEKLNVTENKPVFSSAYTKILHNLSFPRADLDSIYSLPLYKSFYSDEEIEGFYKRWLGPEKTLTVVTVAYNAEEHIEKTILSVVEQKFGDFEYIVIDGNSTDDTMSIVRKYEDKIDQIVSEPDKGIYDAMNKAIDLAHGEWILFMNSNDWFADADVLSDVFSGDNSDADFIYGSHKFYNGVKTVEVPLRPLSSMWKRIAFSHQSLFSRTHIMKEYKFNLEKQIVADYDFYFRCYSEGKRFKKVNRPVSVISGGGFSSTSFYQRTKERWLVVRAYAPSMKVNTFYFFLFVWGLVPSKFKSLARKKIKLLKELP